MERELAGLELNVEGRLLTYAGDGLAADEKIVGMEGFLVGEVGGEAASGDDAQTAVVAAAVAEGEPGGDLLVRLQAEIGGILVPGDVVPIAGLLGPDGRGEDQDVGADDRLDRIAP